MSPSLETASFTLSNLTVRELVLILSLSQLHTIWTAAFIVVVLVLDSLYFHFLSRTIPERFNKLTSWVLSLTTATLVVENISRRERGRDTDRDEEEKKQIKKSLCFQSALNLSIFASHGTLVSCLIFFNLIKTDMNSMLSNTQIFSVYKYILLPLISLNLLSCLNTLLLPASSRNKVIRHVGATFNICLLVFTIIIPIISGMKLIPPSPSDVFILVKVRDSLSINTATTSSNYEWQMDQVWSFHNETGSLSFKKTTFYLAENNKTDPSTWLPLTEDMRDYDRNEIFSSGTIYITSEISKVEVDWKSKLFR